jgi:hypothetical protein
VTDRSTREFGRFPPRLRRRFPTLLLHGFERWQLLLRRRRRRRTIEEEQEEEQERKKERKKKF